MRLVVINHITLDGVMQAPGRPDEDTRDGFRRGGWAAARNDEVMLEALGKRMPVREIRLDVADTNARGRKLFESRGFELCEEDHGYYQGGQRALRMRKKL